MTSHRHMGAVFSHNNSRFMLNHPGIVSSEWYWHGLANVLASSLQERASRFIVHMF